MKVYSPEGVEMDAAKDQMEILMGAGFTRKKPEAKPDMNALLKQKKEADKALAEAQKLADAEAEALEDAELAELELAEKAEAEAEAAAALEVEKANPASVDKPKKITIPKKNK